MTSTPSGDRDHWDQLADELFDSESPSETTSQPDPEQAAAESQEPAVDAELPEPEAEAPSAQESLVPEEQPRASEPQSTTQRSTEQPSEEKPDGVQVEAETETVQAAPR